MQTRSLFEELWRTPPPRALTLVSDARVNASSHFPSPATAGRMQLIRLPQLLAKLGNISRSTVYDWMNPRSSRHDKSFPVPLKLSTGRSVAWIEAEIDAWLANRNRSGR